MCRALSYRRSDHDAGHLTNAFPHAAPVPTSKGRIYIFRMVRSAGVPLDDVLTIDGVPVQRISPGNGIFCDVTPGEHLLGLVHDKAHPLKVLVKAGEPKYVCVMLQHQKGSSLRSGALLSGSILRDSVG